MASGKVKVHIKGPYGAGWINKNMIGKLGREEEM
jgi:hypothetical protein